MFYSIPPFLTAAIFLLSGAFVICKNPKAVANRALGLVCGTTFVWQFVVGTLLLAKDDQTAFLLVKVVYSWVIFVPIAFYHFMAQFGGTGFDKTMVKINYISGCLFLILLWMTPYYISGFYHYSWGYFPKAGPLHPPYLLFHIAFLPIRGLYCVFKEARNENNTLERRHHAQYVGLAILAYYPAATDFLNNYGAGFYPFGFIFTIFSLLILTHAVIRHNLLGITIFLKRGLIYSVVVTGITLFYLVSVFVTEFTFRGLFGYRSIIFSIFFACFVALLFQPFKNRVQSFIDKYFFEGTLETLSAENLKLQEEIRRSDQLRLAGTLASGIAHEIKNPLTSLKTFTSYLEEKHNDPSFRKRFKEVVGREINRIEQLTRNLLNFAKPSVPKFAAIDIHKTLDHTFELVNTTLANMNTSLVRGYHRPNTEILGDASQLQQAFLNLFLNAMDAMPNGGELRISTETEDNWLKIKIEDSGCGMTKEQLDHIFEPFYTTKESGTGLGLSITKRIIEDHKGKIKVTSTLNKGSTFEIMLPLAK